MYGILHTIIFAHTCDFVQVFYVPFLPPPCCSSLFLAPEDWVRGEESVPDPSGYLGTECCSRMSGAEGGGISLGQGRQSLAEGKEGGQEGMMGVPGYLQAADA